MVESFPNQRTKILESIQGGDQLIPVFSEVFGKLTDDPFLIGGVSEDSALTPESIKECESKFVPGVPVFLAKVFLMPNVLPS